MCQYFIWPFRRVWRVMYDSDNEGEDNARVTPWRVVGFIVLSFLIIFMLVGFGLVMWYVGIFNAICCCEGCTRKLFCGALWTVVVILVIIGLIVYFTMFHNRYVQNVRIFETTEPVNSDENFRRYYIK